MYYLFVKDAQLAQLVEQRTENPRVSGSIPELGIVIQLLADGILAQLVEHLTFNQGVGGSTPPCLMKPYKYYIIVFIRFLFIR